MGLAVGFKYRSVRAALSGMACAVVAAIGLSGCGSNSALSSTVTPVPPAPVAPVAPAAPAGDGILMGGQQPVAGVNIRLYTVGTTGYGSAATPLGPAFQTSATGGFKFPAYTCPGGNPLVFMVGTGGTPITGSPNPNLAMMTGLGTCNNIKANFPFVNVNELTTVATVWALSSFMTDPTHIGAPSSNAAGLAQAYAAITKIVDVTTGKASGPTLPAGASLPSSEINALGNILQNCINSAGGVASDSTDGFTNGTPCGKLFYLTRTTSAPTDTITAALNIAQHPGVNVDHLNALQSSTPAFIPALDVNTPPTDWTIAINYTGGGLSNPRNLAVDGSGNVWVTNFGNNSLTELNNNGAALSPAGTGFTAGGTLNQPYSVAIDQSGFVWTTNSGNNSITKLTSSGGSPTTYTSNGLNVPKGIAIDGSNNIWVANNGGNTISGFANDGSALTSSPYSGAGISSPDSIAINPK